MNVVAANVTDEAPGGTVTVDGTETTLAALLVSATTTPPEGAGLVRVMAPVELVPFVCAPITVAGARTRLWSCAGGAGLTVTPAVFVTPLRTAEMVDALEADTAVVVTAKLAVALP